MARILVTGSRDWSDRDAIRASLVQALDLIGNPTDPVLVHGGARGADTIAAEVWREMGYGEPEKHPADWKVSPRAAGHIRNAHMVSLGADICVAFPIGESKGTIGCMKLARKAGIPVITPCVEEDEETLFDGLLD